MNKNDLRNFMIVRNGLDELFLVAANDETHKGLCFRDYNEEEQIEMGEEWDGESIPCFDLDELDDNLVYIDKPPMSIVEVYDVLPIEPPFNLEVEKLFNEYKPKLLWEREPSPLSKSKMCACKTEEDLRSCIGTIVPPYIIVE